MWNRGGKGYTPRGEPTLKVLTNSLLLAAEATPEELWDKALTAVLLGRQTKGLGRRQLKQRGT